MCEREKLSFYGMHDRNVEVPATRELEGLIRVMLIIFYPNHSFLDP